MVRTSGSAKEEMRAVEAEINELRARNKGANTDEAKLQRVVSNKTAQVEALRENRADIIAAARMELTTPPPPRVKLSMGLVRCSEPSAFRIKSAR